MFNTTINKTETNPVTRVVEKSISPDKVVDMYDEVKKQIDTETVSRVLFKSDVLTGVVSEGINHTTRAREIQISFRLNGEVFQATETLLDERVACLSAHELLVKLQERYASEISKILVKKAFSSTSIFTKRGD